MTSLGDIGWLGLERACTICPPGQERSTGDRPTTAQRVLENREAGGYERKRAARLFSMGHRYVPPEPLYLVERFHS